MTNKHTPGPWRYWHEDGYCGELNAPNGSLIAAFESEPHEANARLIAAAPDLLEALQNAHALLQATLFIINDNEARDIAKQQLDANRAAIAKATGGEA
jgi:hypothetical protein